MARVLRADQIPKSVTRRGTTRRGFDTLNPADFILEDFDAPRASELYFSDASDESPEPPRGATLAKNIVKAAELQAEDILARAKNQTDKQLERAKAEANRLVLEAKAEVVKMREGAQKEIQQRFQKAQAEGYEQGTAQGGAAAIQKTGTALNHLSQMLQNFVDQIPGFQERALAQCEAEILELVLVISTKIAGFELSLNPDIVLKIVKSGIELLKDKREVSIRLSPSDLEIVKKYRPELLKSLESTDRMYLITDENLMMGECLIENKSNVVDGTWRCKISNAADTIWELYNQELGEPVTPEIV